MTRKTMTFEATLIAAFITLTTILLNFNIHQVLRIDRAEHFLISFGLFFFAYLCTQASKVTRIIIGFTFSFSVGYLKESFDPQFEIFDIYANFSGILIAIVILMFWSVFSQQNQRSKRVYRLK